MPYAGAGIRVPKTNNALENFNRQMKSHQTFYNRQNLNVFLHRALEIVEERSLEYRIDRKEFQKTCEITDDLLINGYQYSDSEINGKKRSSRSSCNMYVFSGVNMNKITCATGRNWKNAICTCTSFAKNYMYTSWQSHID